MISRLDSSSKNNDIRKKNVRRLKFLRTLGGFARCLLWQKIWNDFVSKRCKLMREKNWTYWHECLVKHHLGRLLRVRAACSTPHRFWWRAEDDVEWYVSSCYHEQRFQQAREFQPPSIREQQLGRLEHQHRHAEHSFLFSTDGEHDRLGKRDRLWMNAYCKWISILKSSIESKAECPKWIQNGWIKLMWKAKRLLNKEQHKWPNTVKRREMKRGKSAGNQE